jgi:hypothetical protein
MPLFLKSGIFKKWLYMQRVPMSVIDEKRNVIPNCNVNEENDHIYVQDVNSYNRSKRQIAFGKHALLITLFILVIVLSIFTLNFGSSGWTLGNMLTFLIAMAALLATGFFARAWNKHYTLLETMKQEGTPCKVPQNDNTQMIHCGMREKQNGNMGNMGNLGSIFAEFA